MFLFITIPMSTTSFLKSSAIGDTILFFSFMMSAFSLAIHTILIDLFAAKIAGLLFTSLIIFCVHSSNCTVQENLLNNLHILKYSLEMYRIFPKLTITAK